MSEMSEIVQDGTSQMSETPETHETSIKPDTCSQELDLPSRLTPEIIKKLDESIRFFHTMCPSGFLISDVQKDMRDRNKLVFSPEEIEEYLRYKGFEEVERKEKVYWFKPESKGAEGNAPSSSNKRKYGDNLN
jgi:hypothetical protein